MSFRDLKLEKRYRTKKCNIINEFYLPVLNQTKKYKRAVGFFSSSALYELAEGINSGIIQNHGHIQLIVSPRLTAEDVIAIKEGYDRRAAIEDALLREFKEPDSQRKKNQLNLLANLIADRVLDIKVAFMKEDELYHEKIGVFYDCEGNAIAINGSNNETYNAFCKNFESFDVFDNWRNEETRERCEDIEKSFDSLWLDQDEDVNTISFPSVVIKKFEQYKELPTEQVIEIEKSYKEKEKAEPFFRAPKDIAFYDYQEEAVANWIESDSIGVFDMATGSGKTYTALYALSELSIKLEDNLAVIIVVPYQHLVEQWVEDITAFNVEPIVAYSSSKYKNWEEKFKNAVNSYNFKVIKNFCIITTTSTFSLDRFQKQLSRIRRDYCLVADEAHNLGAENIIQLLPLSAKYRLALSATIKRYRDENGTQGLLNYFGDYCQKFTLDDAISRGFLTPYYYYPVIVNLSPDELDEYHEISRRISKLGGASEENMKNNKQIELLLLKRSRIVAGAKNKVDALLKEIEKYKNDSHILVYCGATKYDRNDINYDAEVKQISAVTKLLFEKHGFKVRKFTSEESPEERAQIKEMFLNGDELQVITAIKCLDEGVNIPAIKTAFILASSSNPKEYIQRRGRVLRKAKGKKFAEIYDFVTLPRPLTEVDQCDAGERKTELSLVRRELDRMMDFAKTAKNPQYTDEIRELLLSAYGAYKLELEDMHE